MNLFSMYGGCLQSDIPFPGLPAGDGCPTWRLRRAPGAAPGVDRPPLGEDRVDPGVSVRLFRHAPGLRLVYDDSGIFDVHDGGTRIEWYAGANAHLEAVQLDVVGRVLPAALHDMGSLCLHGSAVEVDGAAVAFLAPKHYGKSTLAQAMANAGRRVLSDDVVAVDVAPAPVVRPGVASVRLWRDAAARLGDVSRALPDAYGKFAMAGIAGAAPTPTRVPLDAVYVLTPVGAAAEEAAARTILDPLTATMALLPHNRLAPLLGGAEGAVLLDRVASLVRHTAVYTLSVARDFGRLEEAAHTISSWHTAGARPARRTA
jgi:hypothetical protein